MFSRVRLAIVAAAIVIVVAGGITAVPWVAAPLTVFVLVAILHARTLNGRDRARSAVGFYERALDRVDGRWIDRGETGDRYRPADHPYADDLDIFGRGSLFQLLSMARTRAGEETLARWLLTPAPVADVLSRQPAIRELGTRVDLRESMAVLGDGLQVGVDAAALRAWAAAPRLLHGTWPRLLFLALAIATVWLVVYWATTGHSIALLIVLAADAIATGLYKPRVLAVIESVQEAAHDLDLLVGVLRLVERERFDSPGLDRLRATLAGPSGRASREIVRLERLEALLSSRMNVMFAMPAAMMLWGTQFAFAIEAWRARVGPRIPGWLDAIGEFEALSSIATFASEHPDYAWPTFVDGPACLRATSVAHPLLPPAAVANDAALGGDDAHALVVSGSNMSGKSTYLRALGINVVLAHAGAPVRAAAFELSRLAVGASMRIQDSLQDGRSRFYAEITRLKQVVDLARARGGCVLFLLDEILAGTNSHDRRVGAEALLAGLLDLGAIGLVTTHDLALGEIADRLGPRAANVHFEDRFIDGALHFDYVLRPGIVRTSNAIALMRSIGLDV